MSRTKNSHIQIPRFILEYYTDSRQSLYQLDVKSMEITLGRSRTMNTQKGYYNDDTEELMSRLSESPFSKMLTELTEIDFATSAYEVPKHFEQDVKSFFALLIARGPQMYSMIEKNSVYMRFACVNEEDKPDIAVREIMANDHINAFDGYTVALAVNRSDISFAIPMCAIYGARLWDREVLVFPATPNFAFVLIPTEVVGFILEDQTMRVLLLDDDIMVRRLNRMALYQQQIQEYHEILGYGWVVSNNKHTLECLAEDCKNNATPCE